MTGKRLPKYKTLLSMNENKRGALVIIELGKSLVHAPIIRQRNIRSTTAFPRGTLMTRTAIVKFGQETSQECISPKVREILLIFREAQ